MTKPQSSPEDIDSLDKILQEVFLDGYNAAIADGSNAEFSEELAGVPIDMEAKAALLKWRDEPKADRFEVIDETGRAYVKGSIYGSPVKVELSYQDDDRTLKVFVNQLQKEADK